MLTAALLVACAFAAGVTGAWSPCGFSMVETLAGAAGREGAEGRRLVRFSCATFALGALAGGAVTFGALGLLGHALGAGGEAGSAGGAGASGVGGAGGGSDVALAVAAVLALAAALADLLGVRVAPQIRRQVPEGWRRTLPLPLAAVLYGVLLGLGFTTFVLAFAVWALAGIAVALGDPLSGLAIGLAFGLGRALPVVAMAPRYDTLGIRLAERMASEPRLLRGLRRTDAALLAAAAVALLLGPAAANADAAADAAPARAAAPLASAARATTVAFDATDPSVSGGALAWHAPGSLRATVRLPGAAPARIDAGAVALGGPHLARLAGDTIVVTDWRHGDAQVAALTTGGAVTQIATSAGWVVWRSDDRDGGETLFAWSFAAQQVQRLETAGRGGAISRPALDGDRLAYAVSSAHGSRIVVRDLAAGTSRTRLRSGRTQLDQPALLGARLLYVQRRACDQRLRLTTLGAGRRSTRTLLTFGSSARRDEGHEHHHTDQGSEPGACPHGTPARSDRIVWSTALAARAAYATLWNPRRQRAKLVRIPR